MTRPALRRSAALLLALLCAIGLPVFAIGSSLTYQGHLTDSTLAGPANGSYDLQFTLQDTGGATIGAPIVINDTSVVGGVFTVTLDFGPTAFSGPDRFLQIGVRRGNETGAYTPLTPRSAVTPAPYAQTSTTAGFAATVANDSIGTAQVVNGSVGSADIDASMQRRVAGTCPSGAAITAISATGTVTCQSAPQPSASIIPFASGPGIFSVSTLPNGREGRGLMVGFGGADDTTGDVSSGAIIITDDANLAFVVPRNAILTSVAFHATVSTIDPFDADVQLQAAVYASNPGSNTFVPLNLVIASPSATTGATVTGSQSANIPIAAGDRLLFVVSARGSETGQSTTTSLRVSGGIGLE